MKQLFMLTCLLSAVPLMAQVEIDKPIELTGGTGERYITSLELPSNGTDAANKDYVDAAVAAGGGGSTATMISGESPTAYTYYLQGIIYCRDLVESGYSDWRYPTLDDIEKILADGATIPNASSTNQFIARVSSGGAGDALVRLRFSDYFIGSGNISLGAYYTRCVR